ncbi:MAG: hypothetical protein ACJARF_001858 [Alteromonadaceae bacterium]|jgi:hypothetical protein|uniref:hypothetical protein n=1 Tax=uncultured Alteromonas sp. TaxID=179113 RepID=UPI0030EC4830
MTRRKPIVGGSASASCAGRPSAPTPHPPVALYSMSWLGEGKGLCVPLKPGVNPSMGPSLQHPCCREFPRRTKPFLLNSRLRLTVEY